MSDIKSEAERIVEAGLESILSEHKILASGDEAEVKRRTAKVRRLVQDLNSHLRQNQAERREAPVTPPSAERMAESRFAATLKQQVKFLRDNWRGNDGAEGDTVHAVCNATYDLLAKVDELEARLAIAFDTWKAENEDMQARVHRAEATHDAACRAFAVLALLESVYRRTKLGQFGCEPLIDQIEAGTWPPKSEGT